MSKVPSALKALNLSAIIAPDRGLRMQYALVACSARTHQLLALRFENGTSRTTIKTGKTLSDFVRGGCLMGEMPITPDAQLLGKYVRDGSEGSFRQIVERYTDLVYSSALRQVDSSTLAHDIAQVVFSDLARKAPSLIRSLGENGTLAGWLFRSTRYVALNQLRDNRRRQARERQAIDYLKPDTNNANDWELIRPLLDETMAHLSEEDREVLLLRFFADRGFRAIGQSLGISDDTAQKRVNRALERLRLLLTKRGVTTSAAALSTVLAAHVVTSVPASLAAVLSSTALAGTTFTATASKAIVMTTFQKTLIGSAIVASIGMGTFEARDRSALWTRFQASDPQTQLQAEPPQANPSPPQSDSFSEQVGQLTRERDSAIKNLVSQKGEIERSNRNIAELLKLRGEVGQLRQQVAELTKPPQEQLYTRTYKVQGEYFLKNLTSVVQLDGEGPGLSTAREEAPPSDKLRRFFAENGVVFKAPEPVGRAAFSPDQPVPMPALLYNEKTGTLFARSTMSALDQIETLVQFLNIRPPKD